MRMNEMIKIQAIDTFLYLKYYTYVTVKIVRAILLKISENINFTFLN